MWREKSQLAYTNSVIAKRRVRAQGKCIWDESGPIATKLQFLIAAASVGGWWGAIMRRIWCYNAMTCDPILVASPCHSPAPQLTDTPQIRAAGEKSCYVYSFLVLLLNHQSCTCMITLVTIKRMPQLTRLKSGLLERKAAICTVFLCFFRVNRVAHE